MRVYLFIKTIYKALNVFIQRQVYSIENAHNQLVRDIDFNPNKQYYLASCGDDCKTKVIFLI